MTDATNTISETTTAQAAQAEARAMYRKSAAAGFPLTGKELAEHFGRKERWGQERIREAKDEARESSPVRFPGEVELDGLPPIAPTPPSIRATQSEPQTVSAPTAGPQSEPQKPHEPSAETAEMIMSRPRVSAETAEPQSEPHVTADEAQEPQAARKPLRVWPVWALMLPAAVAIWGGWVGLGEMAGFGVVNLLPGIANVEVNTAITLPIGMEVYAAYALYVWLSGRAVGKAKAFAKRSAITSLVIGAAGQMAYHVMEAAGVGVAPWWITAAVACLPVAVLGMGAALAHMVRAEDETE
jgi:hypothetical protein